MHYFPIIIFGYNRPELLKSCLLLMSGLLILQGLSLLMSKLVFLFEPGKKHG